MSAFWAARRAEDDNVRARIERDLLEKGYHPKFNHTHVVLGEVTLRLSSFEDDYDEAMTTLLEMLVDFKTQRFWYLKIETTFFGQSSIGQGPYDRSGRGIWDKSG